jgi:aquaporin Z
MRKYINEFIGTFFLVLTMVMVCYNGTPTGFAPLAIGIAMAAMIHAGAHISGAHYNPAVTIAFFMQKKISLNDGVAYMAAQIIGAVFAAFTAMTLLGGVAESTDPRPFQFQSPVPPLLAEFIGTFVMVYVILNVAMNKSEHSKSFYGLSVGFIVIANTFVFSPVSGGGFNPAVAIGLSSIKAFDWANLWVYCAGSILGGAVASIIFSFVTTEEN